MYAKLFINRVVTINEHNDSNHYFVNLQNTPPPVFLEIFANWTAESFMLLHYDDVPEAYAVRLADIREVQFLEESPPEPCDNYQMCGERYEDEEEGEEE